MAKKKIVPIELDMKSFEKLKKLAEEKQRSIKAQAAIMIIRALAFVLIGASLGILAASLTGCSAPLKTESDVLRVWGAPTGTITDSAYHIDEYRERDGWMDMFGIYNKDGHVFFHNSY